MTNRVTLKSELKPLQLWMPIFGTSLADAADKRDARRAFEFWRGESTVWLLPDVTGVVRWKEGSCHVLGVPSEGLNRIDIFHVGRNGHVIGPAADRFPNQNVNGLLALWLNDCSITLESPSERPKLAVPHFKDGQLGYVDSEVITPGPKLPITEFDGATHGFSAGWPPESVLYKTVSPEGESQALYGPLHDTELGGIRIAASVQTGTHGLHYLIRFEPLAQLFSQRAGWDALHHLQQMRRVVKMSGEDPVGALAKARELGGRFLFEGQTTLEWQWFWPALDHGGSKAVVFEAEDFGIRAYDWAGLRDHPDFRKLLAKPVATRRVWGPLGLFWSLLLEQLEEHRYFESCQSCGRIIAGKKGKKFCSPEDNPKCHSRRRATDQRRSRGRRR